MLSSPSNCFKRSLFRFSPFSTISTPEVTVCVGVTYSMQPQTSCGRHTTLALAYTVCRTAFSFLKMNRKWNKFIAPIESNWSFFAFLTGFFDVLTGNGRHSIDIFCLTAFFLAILISAYLFWPFFVLISPPTVLSHKYQFGNQLLFRRLVTCNIQYCASSSHQLSFCRNSRLDLFRMGWLPSFFLLLPAARFFFYQTESISFNFSLPPLLHRLPRSRYLCYFQCFFTIYSVSFAQAFSRYHLLITQFSNASGFSTCLSFPRLITIMFIIIIVFCVSILIKKNFVSE